ncbi:MAG TPA: alpha-glucan family phosphorylase [Vicinamibacterales bacterium]|nr:alpha-glucan family phosphorylase [Vicinamibacterales bacterium]
MAGPAPQAVRVAYFSMEIAIAPDLPTYAGGLGILAGDVLRSAADLELPMVGVTLVYREGYFRQRLDADGTQREDADTWQPAAHLERVADHVVLAIDGRDVHLCAWRFLIRGLSGYAVPVYLLDTALPVNMPEDQRLTDRLYSGDRRHRLSQEAVLGLGGVAMLDALGHTGIQVHHMNEGHSGLLALALLEAQLQARGAAHPAETDVQAVRRQCVFTTHTPVPAGQDQFDGPTLRAVLGEPRARLLEEADCLYQGTLNMTYLALRCSRYVNGVAMHHGEISHGMFPNYPIRAITNGVHATTWTAPPFAALYDRHIPEWRSDNRYLRYAIGIPVAEILDAHNVTRHALIDAVNAATGVALGRDVMTLGFARRATAYKRAGLLFSDLDRLRHIARTAGPFQLIFGGKAHPDDQDGKALIRHVVEAGRALADAVKVVYLENYDFQWARRLTSGVDLWLNTPHRPYEASGTSGMKAAINGVPSLSVMDGWWIEGCLEGATGWAVGHDQDLEDPIAELASLYDKLEQVILPMFYQRTVTFAGIMRSTIAINGSFFNTQRMMEQYQAHAYFPESPNGDAAAARSAPAGPPG